MSETNREQILQMLRDSLQEIIEAWKDDGIRDEDVMDFPTHTLKDKLNELTEFKLYRYMPATYFNLRNFETQKIHLSHNGVMNDVYEGVPTLGDDISYLEMKKLDDLASMTCFSEYNNSPLMWSHYADNHRGICVEYDLKRLQDDPFKILQHILPVVYMENRLSMRSLLPLINANKELQRAIDEEYEYEEDEPLDDILPMFLIKGTAWEHEKEWRILYTKKQMYDENNEELYKGNLSFRCISGIYLGYRTDPEIKLNLLEMRERMVSESKPINIYQAKLNVNKYDMEFDCIAE